MNYKKGFFRIWLVTSVIWVVLVTLYSFPAESFKTLKVFGVSRMEYKKENDIKLINCILLKSKKKTEDSPEIANQKLDNILKAPEYAKSIGISEAELINTKTEEKNCNKIHYKRISELQSRPNLRDLISEINKRVEHARSDIFNFLWLLISFPLFLFLLGVAICYVSAGFKKK
ncbi:TPA: hypothetical protein JBI01_02815 [Legionella pneumophila]|nr:hypothetical protein [Legionella pneumophila]